MFENINDVTFLINSCDKYEDIWPVFFKTLKIQFPECIKFPFVLNTETKSFKFEDFDIKCFQFYKDIKCNDSWSKRLYKTLDTIKTEFVVFSLEDFFIEERVDCNRFLESINIARKDDDIDMISYITYGNDNKHYYIGDNKYDFLVLYPKVAKWKITCKIALWRRTSLMSYLNLNESPWEFEIMGTWRACRSDKKFYTIKPGYKVIEYKPYILGLHGNKWKNKNLCEKYFDKLGIKVDFSKRGFVEMNKMYSIISGFPKDIFKKVFWDSFFEKIENKRFSFKLVKMYIISFAISILEKILYY